MSRSSRIGNESETTLYGNDESIVSDHITRTRTSEKKQRASRRALNDTSLFFSSWLYQGCFLRSTLLHSICNARMRTCRRPSITYRRIHRSTCQTTLASSLKWKIKRPTSAPSEVFWQNLSRKNQQNKKTFWSTIWRHATNWSRSFILRQRL